LKNNVREAKKEDGVREAKVAAFLDVVANWEELSKFDLRASFLDMFFMPRRYGGRVQPPCNPPEIRLSSATCDG
jgi:hypothetical protein